MPDDNDDLFLLNDPMHHDSQTVASRQDKTGRPVDQEHARTAPADLGDSARVGEIDIAVPEPVPIDARSMTEDEKRAYEDIDQRAENLRLQRITDDLIGLDSSIGVPAIVRNAGMPILLGLAAVISLITIGQVVSTAAQIAALPVWAQIIVTVMLLVVVLVLVAVIWKLTRLYFRLKANKQISLSGLKMLSDRAELRVLSAQKSSEAVSSLTAYLTDYPVTDTTRLLDAGFQHKELQSIVAQREQLLSQAKDESPKRWLRRVRYDFQEVLDICAKRRVNSYAKQVGLKTAISPMPLLDNAIVLTLSLAMVKDLMTIYNLRTSGSASAHILLKAIVQAYVAGEMQGLTEAAAELGADVIGEQVGQISGKLTEMIGSKTGEGVVNGLMVKRLGGATIVLIQPVGA